MKFKSAKKVMAAVIAAAMVMSSALVVSVAGTSEVVAAEEGDDQVDAGNDNDGGDVDNGDNEGDDNDVDNGDNEGDDKEEESSTVTPSSSSSVSGNDSKTSSSSSSAPQEVYIAPTYEEKMAQSANVAISVAGVEVKTSVAGVYAAESVRGTAVTTSDADVKSALGLTDGQKPVIIIYDVDAKKSVNAMASINAGAESIGADVVASLYIELGAKEHGNWVALSDGSVALKTGLPKGADKSATYSVISVQPGGAITVLEDLDTDPNTVTFQVSAGVGAYAIVAR